MTAHHPDTTARSARRAVLALLLVLLAVAVAAPRAALATEEAPAPAEEKLTYEELQQQASQRAQEFFPDAYEEPSFFQWLSVPNLIGGLVIAALLLAAYLWWQPKFAAERREKQRR
jgi:hypothetical protein